MVPSSFLQYILCPTDCRKLFFLRNRRSLAGIQRPNQLAGGLFLRSGRRVRHKQATLSEDSSRFGPL